MHENLKVLVVHRQVSVANDIKKQFKRAGWLVHLAHSGLDGLLAARKESFGLILTVIDLPVITGIEMMRSIRNISLNINTPAYFLDTPLGKDINSILQKIKVEIHLSGNMDFSSLTGMYRPKLCDYSIRLEPLDAAKSKV